MKHAIAGLCLAVILVALALPAQAQQPAGKAPERSGRTELMVWGTLHGVWLGVGVPAAFDAQSAAPYGVGLIVGGPAGFLAARTYARSRPLSVEQARTIVLGGAWGTAQGFGWAQVFKFGRESGDDGATPQATIVSMLASGAGGIVIGGLLSGKDITPGSTTTVNFGAIWGSWFGGALVGAADVSDNQALTGVLIGGDVGIIATAIGQHSWHFSRARARLISVSGLAGLVAGLGVLLITQPESDQAILVPASTSAAGLALGTYWTRKYREVAVENARTGPTRWTDALAPSVQPRILERVRNGRLEHVPALGLTLVEARF